MFNRINQQSDIFNRIELIYIIYSNLLYLLSVVGAKEHLKIYSKLENVTFINKMRATVILQRFLVLGDMIDCCLIVSGNY